MGEIKGKKATDGKSFRLVGYTVCFATTQLHHLAQKIAITHSCIPI